LIENNQLKLYFDIGQKLPRLFVAMKKIILFFCFGISLCLHAQEYTVNGNARQINCNCYILTPYEFTQSGSVWNNFKIDLTRSFRYSFNVFLGCDDAGADGISFVLQPLSTSVGSTGGGLGFDGITPSVGVTIDTWQNTDNNDPVEDHIAIQLNGNLNHSNATTNLAGPVTALAGLPNIEDCQNHTLVVDWNATTKTFTVFMDGNQRLQTTKDFVADVFGGNPNVFWGFTGGTGGARNLQQFCTALNPLYRTLADKKRCINEPVQFFDSTISFAPILKTYWNFGDGSPIDSINLNPIHTYTAAGVYTVIQTVIGADGCRAVNNQTLTIGSIPAAKFGVGQSCEGSPVQFTDSSGTAVGTITGWSWQLGSNGSTTVKNPATIFNSAGSQNISLTVTSAEGCQSPTTTQVIAVHTKPVAGFASSGIFCQNNLITLTSTATVAGGSISSYAYTLGNGMVANLPIASTSYPAFGSYAVLHHVISDRGCRDSVIDTVIIFPPPTARMGFTAQGCEPVRVQLTDSSVATGGASITSRWWAPGNGDTLTTAAPVVNMAGGNYNLQLVVTDNNGCPSDTLRQALSIPTTPIADFVTSGLPCAGQPINFIDSSKTAIGNIVSWQWQANGQAISEMPLFAAIFTAGTQIVQLRVTNNIGCTVASANDTLLIQSLPLATLRFSNACKDDTVSFAATSANTISNWLWNFGDGGSAFSADTMYRYTSPGSFAVSLQITDAIGCQNTIDSSIEVFSVVANAGRDTIVATGQPLQLQATGGSIYSWNPPIELSNPLIANPVATLSSSRSYVVTVSVPVGCASTDTINIKVYDGPEIYVPKAFSPNNDGLNDLLKVLPVGLRQFQQFSIYNRLGQLVFETSQPGIGWNGTFKGSVQPAGAYVWIARGISLQGTPFLRKGTVVIVR
jgi:gliding motility-associated-like protein